METSIHYSLSYHLENWETEFNQFSNFHLECKRLKHLLSSHSMLSENYWGNFFLVFSLLNVIQYEEIRNMYALIQASVQR